MEVVDRGEKLSREGVLYPEKKGTSGRIGGRFLLPQEKKFELPGE